MHLARSKVHTFESTCPQRPHCQLSSTLSGQSARTVHTVKTFSATPSSNCKNEIAIPKIKHNAFCFIAHIHSPTKRFVLTSYYSCCIVVLFCVTGSVCPVQLLIQVNTDLISNVRTSAIFVAYTNNNTLFLFVDKFIVYYLSEYKISHA